MPLSPDDPFFEMIPGSRSCYEQLMRDDTPPPSYVPQGVITRSRTIQPPYRAESPSTESPGSNRLPLDKYLVLHDDTSDEEMEEITPGNTSTPSTTPSPVSQPARSYCCWKGCKVKFDGAWVYESVWENHIKSSHLGQEDEGRSRRSKLINCKWEGCNEKMRSERIVKHIKEKHLEVVKDSTSPDP